MQLAKQNHSDRRADARKKIMLGGLFVKADLDHFHPHDPATLYGMLLHAKELMKNDPKILKQWHEVGAKEFVKDKIFEEKQKHIK